MRRRPSLATVVFAAVLAGLAAASCGGTKAPPPPPDSGQGDGATGNGATPDAGPIIPDAGTQPDAGALPDAGSPLDAGAPTDAGTPADAGTADGGADGGGLDGGSAPDAGAPDAGTGPVPGETTWLWTSGRPGDDSAWSVAAAPGGGAYLVGTSHPPDAVSGNVFGLAVTALDASGKVRWSKVHGTNCGVSGTILAVTPDEHLLVAAQSVCSGAADGLGPDPLAGGALVELGTDGEFLRLVSSDRVRPQLTSNALMRAGELVGLFQGGTEVRKLLADGTRLWRRNIGVVTQLAGGPDGGAFALVQTSTSGVQLVGLGADSLMLWNMRAPDEVERMAVLTDGALALTFNAQAAGHTLLVLEPDGRERARRALGGDPARPLTVGALPGGGVVVAELASTCPTLQAFSAVLEPLWSRSVDARCLAAPGTRLDRWNAMVPSTDDHLLVVGVFSGRADFGDAHEAEAAGASDAFAIAIAP